MKITIIGHSHIKCLLQARRNLDLGCDVEFEFVQLHRFKLGNMPGALNLSIHNTDQSALSETIASATQDATAVILAITGNAPAIYGLKKYKKANPELQSTALERVKAEMEHYVSAYGEWLMLMRKLIQTPVFVLPSPPPVGVNEWIKDNMGPFKEILERTGISSPEFRKEIYLHWNNGVRNFVKDTGVRLIDLPDDVLTASGFLAEYYYSDEPSHANVAYGKRLLKHIAQTVAHATGSEIRPQLTEPQQTKGSREHPYRALPDASFWKRSVAGVPIPEFDPVGGSTFKILRSDKVATAGSCFAQHISKRLRSGGFQYLVTERQPDADEGASAGSYDFSARYGNIYTARQLLQLFDRAFGYFTPIDSHWDLGEGRYCDPFRPQIEPGGYASVDALVQDRKQHLAAVRDMFRQLDVFVYTLGLTECWASRLDGAVYPLAPGVAGGSYDPAKYQFVNFGANEVVSDLQEFVRKLRLVNPKAKIILTVSPVPLMATYEPHHVLVANTYSKSVLRVAADMVCRSCNEVYYFPSFEIINGNYNRGCYFGTDLRSVTKEGVDHVMSIFMRHLTEGAPELVLPAANGEISDPGEEMIEMMASAEAACDEEMLDDR